MKTLFNTLFLIICFCGVYAQDIRFDTIDSLYNAAKAAGDYPKAIEYAQEGVSKSQSAFGKDTLYAFYLNKLGAVYQVHGALEEAKKVLLEAAEIQQKRLEKGHAHYCRTLTDLGGCYYYLSEYKEAGRLFAEVLQVVGQIRGKNTTEYAEAAQNFAAMCLMETDYEQAETWCLVAKDIHAKASGTESIDYALAINTLASIYDEMGNFEQSGKLYLEAKNLDAKLLGTNHPDYATSVNNMAFYYYRTQQYPLAEPLFKEALAIWEKTLAEDHPNRMHCLDNLGLNYAAMKQYERAEEYYLRALSAAAKVFGKKHINYARTLNNLALLYERKKDFVKSEKLLLQSIEIFTTNFGKENLNVATSLSNLAQTYLRKGALDKSWKYIWRAFDANSAQIDSSFSDITALGAVSYYSNIIANNCLQMMLLISEAEYKATQKTDVLEKHFQIVQSAVQLNDRFLRDFSSEEDKLRNLSNNNFFVLEGIRTAFQLKKDHFEETCFDFAEHNKSVLLMNAVKAERLYNFGYLPDSIKMQEKELMAQQSNLMAALADKSFENQKDSVLNVLNNTQVQIQKLQQRVSKNFPQYATLRYQKQNATISDVQALLGDKTALLEYVVDEHAVYIFYVDKQTVRLHQTLISQDSLKKKIKQLHNALSNYNFIQTQQEQAYQAYSQTAYWFFEQFVLPVLPPEKGWHLVIVPDGELAHLPFEIFLTQPAPSIVAGYTDLNYLIKDFSINYNYSAALWRDNLRAAVKQNNGQMLAMAADYKTKTTIQRSANVLRMREILQPLPSARSEVEALSQLFLGYFAFDSLSNEANFKSIAPQYGIIHLAMHGLLDKRSPILSSLAFSENNDSLENNFLQAHEISKMQLNANLVVLSACETGYGNFEKGNGTASLARAFMYAGVPALVVSLWEVNDVSTAQIMQLFYSNLANGQNKAQALRQAKLDYLAQAKGLAAHPSYWSPFIQLGDNRPIILQTQPSGIWRWLLPLSALLLITVVLFWKRAKAA